MPHIGIPGAPRDARGGALLGNNGNLGGAGNNAISSSPNSGNNSGYGANGGYGGGGGADIAGAAAAAAAAAQATGQTQQTTPGTGYSEDARGMMSDLVGALTSPLGGMNATQDVADAYATGQPTSWGQSFLSGAKDFSGIGNGGFLGSSLAQGLGYAGTLAASIFGTPLAGIGVGALTGLANGADPLNTGVNTVASLAGLANPYAGMAARGLAALGTSYARGSYAPAAQYAGSMLGAATGMPFGGTFGGFLGGQIGRGIDNGFGSQQQAPAASTQLAGLSAPNVTGPVSNPVTSPLRSALLTTGPRNVVPAMFGGGSREA